VYDSILHSLELSGKLDSVRLIVSKTKNRFPTRISRTSIKKLLPSETIQWLLDHNILSTPTNYHFGFVDEFIRVRMIMDSAENDDDIRSAEIKMLEERKGYENIGYFEEPPDIEEIDNDEDNTNGS
jgi:hypothetical protein